MKDQFSLAGKNIVVTGASSGIGRQCCITCSERGATVVAIGRNKDRLQNTIGQLQSGNHLSFIADITDYAALKELVKESAEKAGTINGFVHCAGIQLTLPLSTMRPKGYEDLFAVNVIAGLELAKIISSKKYSGDSGASFVFISSIMGVVGNGALTGYSASKGALISAVRSMAVELAYNKIRVNSLSPGYIQTAMMENLSGSLSKEQLEALRKDYLLGLGSPEDVANAVVFLLSEASRWITGTNLVVDGGYCAK